MLGTAFGCTVAALMQAPATAQSTPKDKIPDLGQTTK